MPLIYVVFVTLLFLFAGGRVFWLVFYALGFVFMQGCWVCGFGGVCCVLCWLCLGGGSPWVPPPLGVWSTLHSVVPFRCAPDPAV